jgi:hypothetical protein
VICEIVYKITKMKCIYKWVWKELSNNLNNIYMHRWLCYIKFACFTARAPLQNPTPTLLHIPNNSGNVIIAIRVQQKFVLYYVLWLFIFPSLRALFSFLKHLNSSIFKEVRAIVMIQTSNSHKFLYKIRYFDAKKWSWV